MRKMTAIFGVAGGVLGLVGLVLAVYFARVLVNLALVIFDVPQAPGAPLMQPWDGAAMAAYMSAWPVLLFAALAFAGAIAVARSPLLAVGLFAVSAVGIGATLQLFSVGTVAALVLAAIWAVRSDREHLPRTSPATWRDSRVFTPNMGPLSPVAVPALPHVRVRQRSGSTA